MATEDFNDYSTVSSSIFYAMRNPPEKQKLLLENLSTQDTTENQEAASTNQVPVIEGNVEHLTPKRKNEVIFKTRPLFTFYSEIPLVQEDTLLFKRKKERKKNTKVSPTRQLLTTALKETKFHLHSQKNNLKLTQKPISKKQMRRRILRKIQDQTIKLNKFIPEKKVVIKIKDAKSQELNGIKSNSKSITNDSDPFPFTNLSEWLIWHHNYPELAFVREAYDPEQIPDEGDIEVFWVNVMNDLEFFNPEWRIKGSNIDINLLKQRKRPDWAPEWDIVSSYTDGFSIYLEDIYYLLSNSPQGLKNYRYPVLQFALKGLLLLDLVYYDSQTQKWFKKGTRENLSRLAKLDQFISEQDNISTYQQNINSKQIKNDWYIGLVCFDLIIIHSSFLRRFSQNHLTEDEKIKVLKEGDLNQIISEKLSTIEDLESIRVKNLRKKLKVQ